MQSIFAEPVRMLSATYNQNALPTMSATTSDTSSSANDLAIHFEVSLEEIKSCGAPLNKPSPCFVYQALVYFSYHVSYCWSNQHPEAPTGKKASWGHRDEAAPW